MLVALIWGFNFIVIEVGLDNFPPLLFAAFRFTFSALPAVFLFGRGNVPWSAILLIGVFLGLFKFSLLFVGMYAGMPAGLAALVLQSQVIFTVVFAAIFLNDRTVLWQKVGIGLGVLGMVVCGTAIRGAVDITALGFGLVIGAGFSWGISNILLRRFSNLDMFRLTIWMSLVPPIPLLSLSLILEENQWEAVQNVEFLGIAAIIYTSLVSTVVAVSIWGTLLRRHSPIMVAPFALLVPVIAIALSALILGETFGPNRIVGSILVLIGLLLIVFGRRMLDFSSRRPSLDA